MDIGLWLKDWSTPLSAGATLAAVIVALGIGVASIVQTQKLQRRERRERLLKEIISWALDVSKCYAPIDTTTMANIKDEESDRRILPAHLSELSNRCQEMILRGNYMSNIALKSKFGRELQQTIKTLITQLQERIELLKRCFNAVQVGDNEFAEANNDTHQHWIKTIRETILDVIKEATNLLCQPSKP